MCWIPKSDDDLEFAPMEHKFNGDKSNTIEPIEWYASNEANDTQIESSGAIRLQVKELVQNNNNSVVDWVNVNAGASNIAPSWYWGQHMNKGRSQTPQLMVMYWRGMPANKDWLRVDVVRNFEALPRNDLKDYVAVKRRQENEKTLNFVKKKSLETRLHNHDLDDAKILESHVKPVIHKVTDHHDVVATLPKENPSWFSRFTSTMGDVALDLLPLAGTAVGAYFGGPSGATVGGMAGSAGEAMLDKVVHPTGAFGGTPYTGNPTYGSSNMQSIKYQSAVY